MKWNSKKLMALALSASMLMGSSMVALAADSEEGSATGTGSVEGSVSTDVFSVVVPTVESSTFGFILDPEGLIEKTEQAHYTGKTFEEGATLFFVRADEDAAYNYTSSSDKVSVTNKSTMAVSVSLKAEVALGENGSGITMTSDNTFAGDTAASIYLALTDGANTKAIDAEEGASLTSSIAAAPAEAYEYSYSSDGGYSYKIKDDEGLTDINFPEYSFYLTGAANSAGDWSELTAATPSVTVTWTIEPTENAAPSIATTTYTLEEGSDLEIAVNLGSGEAAATGISSITYKNTSGATRTLDTNYYTLNNGTLTFDASVRELLTAAGVTTRTFTLIFDDASSTTVDVTLTL